jgi:hypothetical protein
MPTTRKAHTEKKVDTLFSLDGDPSEDVCLILGAGGMLM